MSFESLEIATEFAEATSMVSGGDMFHEQCERRWRHLKNRSLFRWHRWYASPDNRKKKLAYMRAYRGTDEMREKRRIYMASKRAKAKDLYKATLLR